MPDIQTFRPQAVNTNIGWTPTGGTVPGVLADDSDATYLHKVLVAANALVLGCGTHTPAAGHERHRGRVRLRARSGVTQWISRAAWTVDPVTSTYWSQIVHTLIDTDYTSPWTSPPGLLPDAPMPVRWRQETQTNGPGAYIVEAWVDIDSRHPPEFDGDVLDGAGNSQVGGTITDTTVPRFWFDNYDNDSLPDRSWRIWVYTLAQTLAGGFTPFVTLPVGKVESVGSPPNPIDSWTADIGAIPNGDYVAYMQATSTIRGGDAFPGDVETVAFEMDVDTPPPPALTVTVDAPNAQVCWTPDAPNGTVFDDDQEIVIEIQRSDCFRDYFTVYTAHVPLTQCFIDRFVPLFDDTCPDCDDPAENFNCEVIYRARYWGKVGGILMATEWGLS